MFISLKKNDFISAIAGEDNAINCIILGREIFTKSSVSSTSNNVLNIINKPSVQNATSVINENEAGQSILYKGVLSAINKELIKADNNIDIRYIKLINTTNHTVSGIKFYLNGIEITDLITEDITLQSNEVRNIDSEGVTSITNGGSSMLPYSSLGAFPVLGNTNTLYLALDSSIIYYWNGSGYIALNGGNAILPYSNLGVFPVLGSVSKLYLALDSSVIYYWNGSGYIATPPLHENTVTILDRNDVSHFSHAHGTCTVGTKLFIGIRGIATLSGINKIICYPDYNDLTTFVQITGLAGGIESMCYDSVTNKVYAPISGTNTVISADANNILSYVITSFTLPIGNTFAASSPIITDNVHLYICTETSPAYFIKILISSMTLVTTTSISLPLQGAHAGVIDITNGFGYFTTSSSGNNLLKLDLSAMTYTSLLLGYGVETITDDIAFIPEDVFTSRPNLIAAGGELRVNGVGALLINVDDMSTVLPLDFLPTYSLQYDTVNEVLINLSNNGYIETITAELLGIYVGDPYGNSPSFFADTYTFRGFQPNEILMTPDGYFVTSWYNSDGGGNLMKISLSKVNQPVVTKREGEYRFANKPEWKHITVTNADFVAENDTRYYLPASVLTANRIVDMSRITTKVRFVISEDAYILSYSGALVYGWGGSEARDSLDGRLTTTIEKIGSKLVIVS